MVGRASFHSGRATRLLLTALLLVATMGTAVVVSGRRPDAVEWVHAAVITLPEGRPKHALFKIVDQLAALVPPPRLSPPHAMTIGINVPEVRWYASNVAFANLVMGSEWLDGDDAPLAERYQDHDGTLLSLPPGGLAQRFVTIPPTGPGGIEIRCTYIGSGTLHLIGNGQPIAAVSHRLDFRVINAHGFPTPPRLLVKWVDPRRPLRDLDCREMGLARTIRFRPQFLATLRGFRVLRFMDWQNANRNDPVTWAQRHVPTGIRLDRAGVPIEDMLALSRLVKADPWFVMPWNADDDYLTRFAALVRAGVPAGRHVYVEVGNEVWNISFPVGRQAEAEGIERGLSSDSREAGMRRYAQRTGEVMRIWERAFAGRPGLVRVLSTQQVMPLSARIALSFRDTPAHIDALATASYFGTVLDGTANTRSTVLAHLSADLDVAIGDAIANRRIAAGYGKRYLAYEGGEGLSLPDQQPLLASLQHDPAQYWLYKRYLNAWRRQVGDVVCLLTSVARVGPTGAWGLAEREDDSPIQAPKLRAVREETNR